MASLCFIENANGESNTLFQNADSRNPFASVSKIVATSKRVVFASGRHYTENVQPGKKIDMEQTRATYSINQKLFHPCGSVSPMEEGERMEVFTNEVAHPQDTKEPRHRMEEQNMDPLTHPSELGAAIAFPPHLLQDTKELAIPAREDGHNQTAATPHIRRKIVTRTGRARRTSNNGHTRRQQRSAARVPTHQ